ncbi:MAG TPA: hypothetical protein VIV88_07315 [Gemmatimonadales bacterium]
MSQLDEQHEAPAVRWQHGHTHCTREFAIRPIFVTMMALMSVGACSNEPTAPQGPLAVVEGEWTFSAELFSSDFKLQCEHYGTLNVARAGANLTGTVTQALGCVGPSDTIGNSGETTFTGSVGASTIRFTFVGCDYQGDLFHVPIDSAAGDVSCDLISRGRRIPVFGQWSANYHPPGPKIEGSIIIPPGDVLVVTGETLKIAISAHDPRALSWVGYSLAPGLNIADSFAVHDTVFSDTIRYPVKASWEGSYNLDVWARNPYNLLAWQDVGGVVVLNAVRHPYQSVSLGVHAADATYDSVRNVMYFIEPDSARVAVLALNTFTFGAPIHLPMNKRDFFWEGIDILPGGDTVIVALPDTAQLAVLDRLANTVTTSRMTGITSPLWLRTSANRKVFTIGQVDSAGSTFSVVLERDLATGQDSIRRDLGHLNAAASLAGSPSLWGSPDHSKVLVINVTSYPGPTCLYLYDAGTGAFSSCRAPAYIGSPAASATRTGDKWYVGNVLLDGSLNLLATEGNEFNAGISPDGSVAYAPTWYGYDKIALPSGAVLERVRIQALDGVTAQRITVFPDGNRLFMWDDPHFGTNHATVVDLTH